MDYSFLTGALIASAGMYGLIYKAIDLLNDDTRLDISLWLFGEYDGSWTTAFCQMFDAIFGKSHLSKRCFLFSSAISLTVVLGLYCLLALVSPVLAVRATQHVGFIEILGIALTINILADYISLLETRWLIQRLSRTSNPIVHVCYLAFDTFANFVIIYVAISIYLIAKGESILTPSELIGAFSYYSIFFFTTFFTSIWSWIFLLSTFMIRITSSSFSLRHIDLERHPGKIIGAFAALNVFLFFLAVQVVSTPQNDGRTILDRLLCRLFQDDVCYLAARTIEDPFVGLYFLDRKCIVNRNCSDEDMTMIRQSCDKGIDAGCVALGRIQRDAGGWQSDAEADALNAYTRGCTAGGVQSCAWMGYALRYSGPSLRDTTAAAEVFRVNCDRGDRFSCLSLGEMLYRREMPGADPEDAFAVFRKNCDAGDGKSCSWLAQMYRDGRVVPRSFPKAIELLDEACLKGYKIACEQ